MFTTSTVVNLQYIPRFYAGNIDTPYCLSSAARQSLAREASARSFDEQKSSNIFLPREMSSGWPDRTSPCAMQYKTAFVSASKMLVAEKRMPALVDR